MKAAKADPATASAVVLILVVIVSYVVRSYRPPFPMHDIQMRRFSVSITNTSSEAWPG